MEYVEGQSLADYLRVKGPLPYAEACEYVRQAALGLQHAAEQGMVHRDVKPHNLMRTPKGQIKVLDFGLARCGRETEKARTQLTQQGVLMGTADYMAPEQASDSRVADARADVYSLGCTLYHLLTGRVPFPEGGTVEKIIKHAVEQAAPVGALRPDLPVGLVRAVERMMAKAPEQRYQTPGQVAEALAPYAAPGSHPPHVVEVIPVDAVPAFDRRLTPRPSAARRANPILLRRIRWSANFLMLTGWIQGLVGCGMVFGAIGGETWMRLMAPLVILLTVVTLVGAVKMKALQSYRWAQLAALSALVPVTPCFPFTVFFGLRALSCLNDPQARTAFPP
jgi:serine/threonine protein kinase